MRAGSRSIPSTGSVWTGKVELHLIQLFLCEYIRRGHEFCELLRAAFAFERKFVCVHENVLSQATLGCADGRAVGTRLRRRQLKGGAIRL